MVGAILQICCTFFAYNVFKIAFVLFCFASESVRLLLASTSSELRLYINVLETVKFVFCLQIHALAECTMNSKFSILHSAPPASCSIQNFSFIVHSARACIGKQNSQQSLTLKYHSSTPCDVFRNWLLLPS